MTKGSRVADYLGHMLEAIERIEEYTADLDEMAFASSRLIQDAVIRNIEIIGEASHKAQQADPAYVAEHPNIPWKVMYAMRNRVSHGYDHVDLELVWKTIHQDLPVLYRLIQNLRAS